MTDRYGVIGHPISHSKSPVIHRVFARQTGEDLSYEAFDIAPESLAEELAQLGQQGLRGLNVTLPHKTAVTALVSGQSERAALAGAINTLIRQGNDSWTGDNTDGIGLVRDLRGNLGVQLRGLRLLILGAGGAAAGVLPELLGCSPQHVMIANRTLARATALTDRFRTLGRLDACHFGELAGQRFDLVINATSAGVKGETPPFPASIINADTRCYDLSYALHDTPFVLWARQHGAAAAWQGWGMLVEQAAESFFLWRGIRPATAPVLSQLPGQLATSPAN